MTRTAAIAFVTSIHPDIMIEPNFVDPSDVTVYLTCKTRDELLAAEKVVSAALLALSGEHGWVTRRHLSRGAKMWRTVVGQWGGCKGHVDQWRCGYNIVVPA